MLVDNQQDWILLDSTDNSITFKRKFDTCDPFDTVIIVSSLNVNEIQSFQLFLLFNFLIKEQTMHIIWVRSDDPVVRLSPETMHLHHANMTASQPSMGMGEMKMPVVREHDGITPMQILHITSRLPEDKR